MYKVGIGYDSHKFCEGRQLIIGGVKIDYPKGLLGHSDGDVLLHAIADALLGAIGLSDIGIYFPDTDEKYKDIDSSVILEEILKKVNEKGYKIINIDCIIIAEKPRLNYYYQEMIARVSDIIKVEKEAINIKAKTNEGMGFIGKGKGIACYCVVLVKSIKELFE